MSSRISYVHSTAGIIDLKGLWEQQLTLSPVSVREQADDQIISTLLGSRDEAVLS